MADETADVQNHEQLVICIRWVNANFVPREDFIGLKHVLSTKSNDLKEDLKDVLLSSNLSLKKLRGQSYDGAANMSGSKNGVATQMQELAPNAAYIWCNCHLTSLASGDCIKNCVPLRDAMANSSEICKLIKFSPHREALFELIKQMFGETGGGIKNLSQTRWTVRAEALLSIINNYLFLIKTFQVIFLSFLTLALWGKNIFWHLFGLFHPTTH